MGTRIIIEVMTAYGWSHYKAVNRQDLHLYLKGLRDAGQQVRCKRENS